MNLRPYLEKHWKVEVGILQLLETAVHQRLVQIEHERQRSRRASRSNGKRGNFFLNLR